MEHYIVSLIIIIIKADVIPNTIDSSHYVVDPMRDGPYDWYTKHGDAVDKDEEKDH